MCVNTPGSVRGLPVELAMVSLPTSRRRMLAGGEDCVESLWAR